MLANPERKILGGVGDQIQDFDIKNRNAGKIEWRVLHWKTSLLTALASMS